MSFPTLPIGRAFTMVASEVYAVPVKTSLWLFAQNNLESFDSSFNGSDWDAFTLDAGGHALVNVPFLRNTQPDTIVCIKGR